MSKHQASIKSVSDMNHAKEILNELGCDLDSIPIMAPKMITRIIKLENVVLQDAIIIKQDMLSIGGEVAVPRDTFALHKEKGNILIIGTINQLNELINKINRHYPRLKKLSKEIKLVLKDVK